MKFKIENNYGYYDTLELPCPIINLTGADFTDAIIFGAVEHSAEDEKAKTLQISKEEFERWSDYALETKELVDAIRALMKRHTQKEKAEFIGEVLEKHMEGITEYTELIPAYNAILEELEEGLPLIKTPSKAKSSSSKKEKK